MWATTWVHRTAASLLSNHKRAVQHGMPCLQRRIGGRHGLQKLCLSSKNSQSQTCKQGQPSWQVHLLGCVVAEALTSCNTLLVVPCAETVFIGKTAGYDMTAVIICIHDSGYDHVLLCRHQPVLFVVWTTLVRATLCNSGPHASTPGFQTWSASIATLC